MVLLRTVAYIARHAGPGFTIQTNQILRDLYQGLSSEMKSSSARVHEFYHSETLVYVKIDRPTGRGGGKVFRLRIGFGLPEV